MPKAKRKPKQRASIEIAEPTPEQRVKGQFNRLTMAYRRVPVIDTLVSTGKLSARQFNGLARYRDVAIAEERSPMRDSLDKALHGRAGSTDGTGYIRTAYELQRLENALGSLYPIARAIAVDDMTPEQWAIHCSGGIEERAVQKNTVTIQIVPSRPSLERAIMEVKMAGERLAAAVGV